MPCHHSLAEALRAYIDAARIAEDRKGWLPRRDGAPEQPMAQADAWRMIRRRAVVAGIMAPIGNHTSRATGITAYLGNGRGLEHVDTGRGRTDTFISHWSPVTSLLPKATIDWGFEGNGQASLYLEGVMYFCAGRS